MMPRPVCVKCEVEYRVAKNEVLVEERYGFAQYRLWFADLWRCPKCGHKLIVGFGRTPYGESTQFDYAEKIKSHDGPVYRFSEF
jgi:hypothetical protein